MSRTERLALHALLYCICAVACLNIGLLTGLHIGRWSLPTTYLLYLVGWTTFRRLRGLSWPSARQIMLYVAVPVALLAVAWGLSTLYDTSWDGQDYHQSAIIALRDGWNPWRSSTLPIHVPASGQYAVGYPKATWLLQASTFALTGRLQSVAITNVVVGCIAAVLVYGALRRLGLKGAWHWIITGFAVLEIHFVQQLPTFMADGYGYALSLAALSMLLLYARDKAKLAPLLGFLSAWLLLVGSKFSNLVVCAFLAIGLLVLLARDRVWKQRWFAPLAAGFVVVGALVLWVPFGTNSLRYNSPLYPQNQPGENAKLRFDNVPNNLKRANRFELLGYGIFSHTEAPDAGNPKSKQNVAQLKVPFTFHGYEVGQINNFQGRVASAGVLFSGIFATGLLLLAWLLVRTYVGRADMPYAWRLTLACATAVLIILIAALCIPVPNKLRYSPLVTLIPVIILALAVRLSQLERSSFGKAVRAVCVALALCMGVNLALASGALVQARVHEASIINHQLSALKRSGDTYQVSATAFYGSYERLQEHHIPIIIVSKLACSNPLVLQYTYGTTNLCVVRQ